MGTTKDPEGFRRHTAGRGDVLGVKGGGAKRRGCGLGLGALLAAGLLGSVVWALRGEPERRAVAVASPAAEEHGAIAEPVEAAGPQVERAVAVAVLGAVAWEGPRTAAHADSFAAAAGAPSISPSKLSTIRLLRAWSAAPLADVQVRWLGRAELRQMRDQGLRVTTASLAPVLMSRGRIAASGADGLLRVAADGAHLLVEGDGWTRELVVHPLAGGVLDVRVFAPRTLVVEVLDWRARPALGFPVEFWSVDALGVPRTLLETGLTSQVTGVLRLEDVDMLLEPALVSAQAQGAGRGVETRRSDLPPMELTRVRVALDAESAPEAWQEIDLALEPLSRLTLQLPPLGELSVLVAHADGSPVEWAGHVELRLAEDQGNPLTCPLSDGRALFSNLRLGRELRAVAVRAEGAVNAKGAELVFAALTPDAPAREVVLADVPGSPRIRLRPLDPDGHVLPRTWIDVHVEIERPPSAAELEAASWNGRLVGRYEGRVGESGSSAREPERVPSRGLMSMDSWLRVLHTDAHGYLDLPMPKVMLEAPGARLSVSLLREGVKLSSVSVAVQRGEAWGDVDLGLVPLAQRSE